jgi:hypothetical protein
MNKLIKVICIFCTIICLVGCSSTDGLHKNIMTEDLCYSLVDFNRDNVTFPEIKDSTYTQNYLDNLAVLYNIDTTVSLDNISYEIIEDETEGYVILYYESNDYNKLTYMLWSYEIEDNLIVNLKLKRTLLQEAE